MPVNVRTLPSCMLCQPSYITLGSGELAHLINMLAVVIGVMDALVGLSDFPKEENFVCVYPVQV